MASAEARARWIRNANRCFVKEDYCEGGSRTPSSSSSKFEFEGSPGYGAKTSDILPDIKWWLHHQPNSMHQKVYSLGQPDVLGTEIGVSSAASANPILIGKRPYTEFHSTQTCPIDSTGSFWDTPSFCTCMENEQNFRGLELEAVISDTLQRKPMTKDIGEFWYANDDLVELDSYKCVASEQHNKLFSEMESQWIGVEKTEPWWHTADVHELASFVSRKSIENCDLPQSQRKHTQCFNQDKGLASLDQSAEKGVRNVTDSMLRTPTSVSMGKGQYTPGAVGCSPSGSDSPCRNNGFSPAKMGEAENLHSPSTDLSKAQLLEALCHSQTRAREAEKAAQQAYDEREHIIKLFFRQASQLFAYKQWLQILQLESLCLQLRNDKNQSIHNHTGFPPFLPWVPGKSRQRRKAGCKAGRKKPSPPRYRISKCARAFLIGFSLAGAGLLLGWTMGWLFPAL